MKTGRIFDLETQELHLVRLENLWLLPWGHSQFVQQLKAPRQRRTALKHNMPEFRVWKAKKVTEESLEGKSHVGDESQNMHPTLACNVGRTLNNIYKGNWRGTS